MPDYTQSLHRLKDEVNQWRQMAVHIQGTRTNIEASIEATQANAPIRNQGFQLDRDNAGNPQGREARWERAIWGLWGRDFRSGAHFLEGVCEYIHAYAVPLYAAQAQDGWGEVDLVGVAPNRLPVVIELKEPGADDTPLKIMLQAAAYGIAIQKVWREGTLRTEWIQSIGGVVMHNADDLPNTLDRINVVGLVPDGYLAALSDEKKEIIKETRESMRCLAGAFEQRGIVWTFARIPGAQVIQ
ncbi:MAG: hypothetical protein GC164_16075 [Phycisphaera sp.]|nr:hypothetical protein [Phycisphaera sp.]